MQEIENIASEAARQIWGEGAKLVPAETAIIKSAVERADIEGYWRGRGDAERFWGGTFRHGGRAKPLTLSLQMEAGAIYPSS